MEAFRHIVLTFLFFISYSAIAQTGGSPLDFKMNDLDQFRNTRDKYTYEVSYLVNGQTVLGSPYFIDVWLPGIIKTKDERVFNGYKLKYDILNQKLFFQSGNEPLEVTDEIAEFSLIDSNTTFHFFNVDVPKQKAPAYYQTVIDDTAGKLLFYNQKKVSDETFGLPAFRGKKHFEPVTTFYFFNNKSKKLEKLNPSGSNINSVLGIDNKTSDQLNLSNYNFREDGQMIVFFKAYFQYLKEKHF